MIHDLLMVLSGIGGGLIFVLIKNKLFSKIKKQVNTIPEVQKVEGAIIDDVKKAEAVITPAIQKVETTLKETFDKKKLINGTLNVKDPVLWWKDITSVFNLRKLVIVGVILSVIWGYGYYKGQISKPVHFNFSYESELTIPVPEGSKAFFKPKNSSEAYWIDSEGKRIPVKVKDIKELKNLLRPYGFDIRPFVTAGGSLGLKGAKAEAGIGMQWFKWFRWHVDSFLTSVGIYPAGVSYRISNNFDLLGGYGYGYKGDQRIYLGGKWKF